MPDNDWWMELYPEVSRRFPGLKREDLISARGDLSVMIRLVASSHDLTISEASEMVAYRLVPLLTQPRYHTRTPLKEAG